MEHKEIMSHIVGQTFVKKANNANRKGRVSFNMAHIEKPELEDVRNIFGKKDVSHRREIRRGNIIRRVRYIPPTC